MRVLLLVVVLISINANANFHGCKDVALKYAIDRASKVSQVSKEKLRAIAEVKKIKFDNTYGTGEFNVTFVTLSYTVAVWTSENDDGISISCDVIEGESFENTDSLSC